MLLINKILPKSNASVLKFNSRISPIKEYVHDDQLQITKKNKIDVDLSAQNYSSFDQDDSIIKMLKNNDEESKNEALFCKKNI